MKRKVIIILFNLTFYIGFSQPPTNKQILKIADNIEKSIENNYLRYFNSLFDYQYFNELFLTKTDNNLMQSFNTSFIAETKQSLRPGELIQNEIGQNGSYKFLGIKKTKKDTILVFQLLNDDGLNYYELYLSKISGEFRITDIYNYSRYELLSESIGKIYYQSLYEIFPEKEKSKKVHDHKAIDKLEKKLTKLIVKEKYIQVLKEYKHLPETYKNNKQIILLAIKAASFTSEKETETVLNRYFKNFNSDKRIYLLPIDGLFSIGIYNRSLLYLDELEKEVCGDPFLNFYRGKIQDKAGNTKMAEQYYTKLSNSLPELQTGYFSLLELYIKNKKYSNAVEILETIESNFGYYKEDLKLMLQNYSGFSNSNEFTNWYEF